ncbi:hypothetical protein CDIK_3586 [Cucumispora dikerogammari]|nr:hypothetical protein CDIK_3586 [Cucumispora dikerogammari]
MYMREVLSIKRLLIYTCVRECFFFEEGKNKIEPLFLRGFQKKNHFTCTYKGYCFMSNRYYISNNQYFLTTEKDISFFCHDKECANVGRRFILPPSVREIFCIGEQEIKDSAKKIINNLLNEPSVLIFKKSYVGDF